MSTQFLDQLNTDPYLSSSYAVGSCERSCFGTTGGAVLITAECARWRPHGRLGARYRRSASFRNSRWNEQHNTRPWRARTGRSKWTHAQDSDSSYNRMVVGPIRAMHRSYIRIDILVRLQWSPQFRCMPLCDVSTRPFSHFLQYATQLLFSFWNSSVTLVLLLSSSDFVTSNNARKVKWKNERLPSTEFNFVPYSCMVPFRHRLRSLFFDAFPVLVSFIGALLRVADLKIYNSLIFFEKFDIHFPIFVYRINLWVVEIQK